MNRNGRNNEPFGRWLIRQLIAALLGLVLILVLANVLPEILNAYFQTVIEQIGTP